MHIIYTPNLNHLSFLRRTYIPSTGFWTLFTSFHSLNPFKKYLLFTGMYINTCCAMRKHRHKQAMCGCRGQRTFFPLCVPTEVNALTTRPSCWPLTHFPDEDISQLSWLFYFVLEFPVVRTHGFSEAPKAASPDQSVTNLHYWQCPRDQGLHLTFEYKSNLVTKSWVV